MVSDQGDDDVSDPGMMPGGQQEIEEEGDENRLTTIAVSLGGYCLWEYDGNTWNLKKDASTKGHGPSAPPSAPGRYRGQLRATLSVPLGPGKKP